MVTFLFQNPSWTQDHGGFRIEKSINESRSRAVQFDGHVRWPRTMAQGVWLSPLPDDLEATWAMQCANADALHQSVRCVRSACGPRAAGTSLVSKQGCDSVDPAWIRYQSRACVSERADGVIRETG